MNYYNHNNHKILVVDDEKLIVKGIKFSLEQDDIKVDTAFDGEEAINKIKNNQYDLLILDLMLPKLDGLQVCQLCREFSSVPIIILTAKGDDMDKIMGLEYGADDYMTKPFNILELKARVKAILRRVKNKSDKNNFKSGEIEIDKENKRIFINGEEKKLTAKEFILLDILISNSGKVYTRENLLVMVWGKNYPGDTRTVDVHIRRLREKIEPNPSEPKYILTKWGAGYYFKNKK